MKIRAHRGSLEEAMATVRDIEPTIQAVLYYLADMGDNFSGPAQVMVIPYGWDERIGWDTFIVTVNGQAVAFTDGPVEMTLEQIASSVAERAAIDTSQSMWPRGDEPAQFFPAVQPLPEHFVPALLEIADLWRRDT